MVTMAVEPVSQDNPVLAVMVALVGVEVALGTTVGLMDPEVGVMVVTVVTVAYLVYPVSLVGMVEEAVEAAAVMALQDTLVHLDVMANKMFIVY